jgi:hypothetical protein
MSKRDEKGQDFAIAIDPAIEAQADDTLRRILAHYAQPAPVPPPPELAARVLTSLPDVSPGEATRVEQHRHHRSRVAKIAAVFLMIALCLVGVQGIFVDSTGMARLFGDTATGLGSLMLTLILIAKPLVHSVLAPGFLPLLVAGAALVGVGIVWWHLVEPGPPLSPLKLSGART